MSQSPFATGTTHFGFRTVQARDKQKLVGSVFTSVARRYDVMNDLMSLGIHRVWKRFFVAIAQVKSSDCVLDLAGGTGDIAKLLHRRLRSQGTIVLGDINAQMLAVGRDRLINQGVVAGIHYAQCNAESLPFPDHSFDLVTMSFGLRNVTDKQAALDEMYRVLKVGGQAHILEFSHLRAAWFRPVYDAHCFHVLPRLGRFIANDAESYQYLAESIRQHPPQETLKAMMEQANFALCRYKDLTGGIVAIHSGYKT